MTNAHTLKIHNYPLSDVEIQTHLLPTLTFADLQNCPEIGDQTLESLATSLKLRTLRWIDNPQATAAGHIFFAHRASLQSLNVSGCHEFTDTACRQHLDSLTLQSLDVSFCPRLTDDAFSQIKAPLTFLNIQGCTELTDHLIDLISQLKTLKHLFLAFNKNFTKNALRSLEKLPLQTLKIYGLDF
jgi:F-box/leucine-rich repeat protein 14